VHLAPFLAIATVVVVTPGVDMALVTKNALLHGRRSALATALGVNLGIALWTVAAALGVAALIAASASLFAVVKLAGAVYLVYLGVQALLAARRGATTQSPGAPPLGVGGSLRQGLVSNLLNPKIAVFFTSLLPQFVAAGSSSLLELLLLGAIFNTICLAWLTLYGLAAARGRTLLRRPRVKSVLDVLSGVVLIGLGTRLALERRS
jgi:threonine/homoserine/homoserine lactone efflux protein